MTPLGVALGLVRAAARLVPRWQRAAWQREWRAELHTTRSINSNRLASSDARPARSPMPPF
jgi:hypothetical protein